jgi:hypothetical protein
MENKDSNISGFAEVFFGKLKEQSFTIILMVGMLIYQRSILREQYLIQQRDTYVDDLMNQK